MAEEKPDKEIVEEARRRVEAKRGFFIHLAVYIVVNAAIVGVWWFTGGGYPWFWWVVGGWGIGLVFNFLTVFAFGKMTNWERKQLQKEIEALKRDRDRTGGGTGV